jgi:hypothetical protein
MTRAVEAYRDVVVGALGPRSPADVARIVAARRTAGVSISEAETSLERWLAEPIRRGVDEVRALEQITFARRLGLSVTALDMLGTHAPPGSAPPTEALDRVQRFSELLRGVSSPSGDASLPVTPRSDQEVLGSDR